MSFVSDSQELQKEDHRSREEPDRSGITARPVVLFVLGMGRSGTSALARILSLCGGALPDDLRGADAHNVRGYWEPRTTLDLNETILRRHGTVAVDPSLEALEDDAFDADEKAADIAEIGAFLTTLPAAPLVVIKDPHITVVAGMWFAAARRAGFDVVTVIAVRHPQEVVASLGAAGPMSQQLSSAVWLKANLLAERHTRGVPRVFVDYANLLADWRREIARISRKLGVDLDDRDDAAIEAFLSSDLRRQRHSGPVTDRFGTDWMSTVYETIQAAARDESVNISAMDRVYEAYRVGENDFRTALENCRALLAVDGDLLYTNSVLLRLKRLLIGVAATVNRRKGSWASSGGNARGDHDAAARLDSSRQ